MARPADTRLWLADGRAERLTLLVLGLQWAELPRSALYLAAQAHLRYRRRGGTRAMELPDFLIGAHAAARGWPVLTRDRRRFDACFSDLEIVAPA